VMKELGRPRIKTPVVQGPFPRGLPPNPAGLLLVASELGVAPESTVYVGDRVDVDAVAARRAGMRAYMLKSRAPSGSEDWISIDGFSELTGMWYPDH